MMNRLTAPCPCCEQMVEWIRDHISGPDHYRCSNCFEIVSPEDVDDLKLVSTKLKQLEEQKHAILTENRLGRR